MRLREMHVPQSRKRTGRRCLAKPRVVLVKGADKRLAPSCHSHVRTHTRRTHPQEHQRQARLRLRGLFSLSLFLCSLIFLFWTSFSISLGINMKALIVMSSSKDWSFNQILANFWSFLSISAFVSIIFYNFAIKQQ